MKNFSDTNNDLTGKDHLIFEMVQQTGLSTEKVTKLYESFALTANHDLQAISENFRNFINTEKFDFESFKESVIATAKAAANPQLDDNQRYQITSDLIRLIEKEVGFSVDKVTLLEIVCFVLFLKDEKFQKVQSQIQFGNKMNQLFEAENINLAPINVSKNNNQTTNLKNAKENVRLYESLKTILSRNEKHWGYNYHLDNAYSAIVEYLDKEIIELVNMDNMVSISNNYHEDIINDFLRGKNPNPLYRSADNIKKLVPDIQTLVFDMMLLVHSYINTNRQQIMFLARGSVMDYENATKNLFASISSSLKDSKVSIINSDISDINIPELLGNGDNIFRAFEIDYNKLQLYSYPVTISAALNMVHLMKACSGEFNLKIRGLLNVYVTKTIEILVKTEKRILMKQANYY
jgi:hypothetical protein